MRFVGVILAFFLFIFPICVAQSPADGHLEGNTYLNSYFHFTYAWPGNLQPIDIHTLNIHPAHPNPNEYPLFAVRQGTEPFGIVMIAEKLHVPTEHNPTGFKDGADFLNRIGRVGDPSANMKVLGRKRTTNVDGLLFDEFDYIVANEYQSGVAMQIGEYIVVFKCNAKSSSDLAVMTKSILAIRHPR
jgi:hypothetical protein